MHILMLVLLCGLLAACSPKETPIAMPDAQAVPPSTPEEMATFTAPSLFVPPIEAVPAPVIAPAKTARRQ